MMLKFKKSVLGFTVASAEVDVSPIANTLTGGWAKREAIRKFERSGFHVVDDKKPDRW